MLIQKKKSGNLSYAPRMYEQVLALNNLQSLICDKPQPNQITLFWALDMSS